MVWNTDGSYEEFIASEPDMVIESIDEGGDGDLATVQERQDKFGEIPVVAVNDTTDVEKVDGSITFIGDVLGAQDNAKKLTDFNDKYLDMVHQKSGQITDKKQYIMLRVMTDFRQILPIPLMGS